MLHVAVGGSSLGGRATSRDDRISIQSDIDAAEGWAKFSERACLRRNANSFSRVLEEQK